MPFPQAKQLGIVAPPQGRLTLTSGTPRMASAVSGAGTPYYTPDVGNLVPLWNGSAFVPTTFAELSQALSDTANSPSAAAPANVYDLFVWLKGGTTPTLSRGPTWTAGAAAGSNTVRGQGAGSTALTRVQGIQVNAFAVTNGPAAGYGTHVGTIATDASGATVSFSLGGVSAGGTPSVIGLWNRYNPVPFVANVRDSTSSWTWTTAGWRMADGSAGNRVTFVSGDASAAYAATYDCVLQNSTAPNTGHIGIGLDVTNTPTYGSTTGSYQAFANNALGSASAKAAGAALSGQHFFQALEYGSAGQSFFGVSAPLQSSVLIVTGSY